MHGKEDDTQHDSNNPAAGGERKVTKKNIVKIMMLDRE
jgi:hypothetical protein